MKQDPRIAWRKHHRQRSNQMQQMLVAASSARRRIERLCLKQPTLADQDLLEDTSNGHMILVAVRLACRLPLGNTTSGLPKGESSIKLDRDSFGAAGN